MKYLKLAMLLPLMNCGQNTTQTSDLNVGQSVQFLKKKELTQGIVQVRMTQFERGMNGGRVSIGGGSCTGALIAEDLVLTAAHCMTAVDLSNPKMVEISVAEVGRVTTFILNPKYLANLTQQSELKLKISKVAKNYADMSKQYDKAFPNLNEDEIRGYELELAELKSSVKEKKTKLRDLFLANIEYDLAILKLEKKSDKTRMKISESQITSGTPVFFAGYGIETLDRTKAKAGILNTGFNFVKETKDTYFTIASQFTTSEPKLEVTEVMKQDEKAKDLSIALQGDSGGPVVRCEKPKENQTYNESCQTNEIIGVWSVVQIEEGLVQNRAVNIQSEESKKLLKRAYEKFGKVNSNMLVLNP